MSTLTLRPALSKQGPSGSKRDPREHDAREKMRPRHGRIMAITAGVIAVGLFSIFAPIAWDPTPRLWALDDTSTDVDIASERPFEMHPTLMGPAITSEMLILIEERAKRIPNDEEGTVRMPPIDVRGTPERDDVSSPQG